MRTGIAGFFDWIFVSGETGFPKPQPQMFESWLQAAHCSPAQALFVGDSLESDIEPTRALGIRTLQVTPGLRARSDGLARELLQAIPDGR